MGDKFIYVKVISMMKRLFWTDVKDDDNEEPTFVTRLVCSIFTTTLITIVGFFILSQLSGKF